LVFDTTVVSPVVCGLVNPWQPTASARAYASAYDFPTELWAAPPLLPLPQPTRTRADKRTPYRFTGDTLSAVRAMCGHFRVRTSPRQVVRHARMSAEWWEDRPVPSRLRFVLGQLGSKPGADQTLLRLLDAPDLPGAGWRVVDERTWRTGSQRRQEAWVRRARQVGSVTGWRSFRGGDRWLWVQLVPLASADDGPDALRSVPGGLLRNLRSKVVVESEAEVPSLVVPGAEITWARGQRTSGQPSGTTLMLAWTAQSDLVVSAASGTPDWSWDELTAIAAKQCDRLTST